MSRYESPHRRTPSPQPGQLSSSNQNQQAPPSPSPSSANGHTSTFPSKPPHSRLSLGPNVGLGNNVGTNSPGRSDISNSANLAPNNSNELNRSTPNLNRHTITVPGLPASLGAGLRHVSGPGGLGRSIGNGGASPSLSTFGSGAVSGAGDVSPGGASDQTARASSRQNQSQTQNQTQSSFISPSPNLSSINPGLRSVSSGNTLPSSSGLRPQSEYLLGNNGRLGVGIGGGGVGMGIGGFGGGGGGLGGMGLGGGTHLMASPDINQDSWVSDYEAQLEAMASASMEQNFIDELQAIESWFRVLTENERTATLYSLLQQSTPLQIRFFQNVLRQMGSADPMTALLSPAVGGQTSMQAAQEAVGRYNLGGPGVVGNGMGGLRSPGLGNGTAGSLRSPGARGFDLGHPNGQQPNSPMAGHFLGPESAAAMDTLSAQIQRSRNRTSAPGTLTGLAHDIGRFASQLDNVIERGPSPGGESNGGRSPVPGGNNNNNGTFASGNSDLRPKSTDFAGMVQQDTQSPFQRSPRPDAGGNIGIGLGLPASEMGNNNSNQTPALQLPQQTQFAINNASNNPLVVPSPRFDAAFSPLLTGNWASIVNTPLLPMFNDNSDMVGAALQAASNNLAGMNLGGAGNNRVVLDDPTKFRRPNSGDRRGGNGNGNGASNNSGLYNDEGDMLAPGAAQPGRATSPAYAAASWRSSPLVGQDGFSGNNTNNALSGLTGLGMGMSGFDSSAGGAGLGVGLGSNGGMSQFGYASMGGPGAGQRVSTRRVDPSLAARRSPLLRQGSAPPGNNSNAAAAGGGGGGAGQGAGVAGPEDVREGVLRDIPTWLRILRLHKYTTNFAQSKWQDMIQLGDDELVDRGVAALGARRKMLKAFANVRIHYGIPHPEGYVPDTTSGPGDE